MLRYEVYHEWMLKAVSISNDYNIKDFPYLEKNEIFNGKQYNTDLKKINANAESRTQLHEAPNNHLLKYFWVSTEVDEPRINLIPTRSSASKKAEKMAKAIAAVFNAQVKTKGCELDNILIDFIESLDGNTYFMQVKTFKVKK